MKKLAVFAFIFPVASFAQNVGINITTPLVPLHIRSSDATGVRIDAATPSLNFYDGTTHFGYLRYSPGTSTFDIATPFLSNRSIVVAPNQLPLAYFTSNGSAARVGIGIAPAIGKLDISHNSSNTSPHLTLIEEASDYARIRFQNNTNPFFWTIEARNNASIDQDRVRFVNSSTGELMTITGPGSVGIGTIPTATTRFAVTSGTNTQFGSVFSSSNGADNSVILSTAQTAGSGFFATGVSVSQVATEGRGIGINSTAGYIAGNFISRNTFGGAGNYGVFSTTETDGNAWAVYGHADNVGSTIGGVHIGVYGSAEGGTTNWAFYGTGNAFLSGGTWQASDEMLKTGIQPLQNATDKLLRLNPKSYRFRSGSNLNLPQEMQFGFLASDVEQVFPDLVKQVKHVQPGTMPGQPEQSMLFKAVNYTGLLPVVVQVIKEQSAKIDLLVEENGQLKTLLQELNNRIDKLERK